MTPTTTTAASLLPLPPPPPASLTYRPGWLECPSCTKLQVIGEPCCTGCGYVFDHAGDFLD